MSLSSFSLYMKNISSSELFPNENNDKCNLLEEGVILAYPIINEKNINIEGYGFYVNTETNELISCSNINNIQKRIPLTILHITNNKTKIKHIHTMDCNIYYKICIINIIILLLLSIIILLYFI